MINITTRTSFRIFAIISLLLLNAGQELVLAGPSSSSPSLSLSLSASKSYGSIGDLSPSIHTYRRCHYHSHTSSRSSSARSASSRSSTPAFTRKTESRRPPPSSPSPTSKLDTHTIQLPRGGSIIPSRSSPKYASTKSSISISSSPISASAPDYHTIPRGGALPLPAGWHPYGYGLTDIGLSFLEFEGSRDSDIGRFLSSLKSGRKKQSVLREQWVEIVRVSKSGQSMRILRTMDDLIDFCIKAGFIS